MLWKWTHLLAFSPTHLLSFQARNKISDYWDSAASFLATVSSPSFFNDLSLSGMNVQRICMMQRNGAVPRNLICLLQDSVGFFARRL